VNVDPACYRFRHDDPARYGIATAEPAPGMRALTHGLAQHVRVSARVLPRLFRATQDAAQRLSIAGRMTVFVYASPEINASVCTAAGAAGILIFVSSALLTSLTEAEWQFVIGHELGHHAFGHHLYPPLTEKPSLRLLELKRAAEISADRAGLMACGGVEIALRAMLKVASGLDERLLEINVSDYIRQISELRDVTGDDHIWYSTHPPFPVRVRSVLRFDSVVCEMQAGGNVGDLIRGIDNSVERDMRSIGCGPDGGGFVDQGRAAAFWNAAAIVCGDGTFTAHEQGLMTTYFGNDRVLALKRMLEACGSRDEAMRMVAQTAERTRYELDAAPMIAIETYDEVRARLAAVGIFFGPAASE